MSFKNLLWMLVFLCSLAKADPMDHFVDSFSEQNKAVAWAQTSTKGKVGVADIRSTVSEAYANAISRQLNPRMVIAMIRQESNFNPKAKSFYGARGVMQVVPRFHKDKLRGRDPFKIEVSTDVGTQILQDCMDKFKGSEQRALKCYSGGARNYHAKVTKFQFDFAQSLKPSGEVMAIAD